MEDLKLLKRSILSADATKKDKVISDLRKQVNGIIKKLK